MQGEGEKITVDILALAETSPAVLYSIHEVLDSVGSVWAQVTGETEDISGFAVRVASPLTGTFRSYTGAPIAPDAGLDGQPDVIIVPDLLLSPNIRTLSEWQAAVAWLRQCHTGGATICTVCTGAVLLAETTLLDGREATTHWSAVDLFRENFPAINLRPELIFAAANPEHTLITSGGSASWAELCLYLIQRYFGYEAAAHAAKVYLLGDRTDGQLPFAHLFARRDHDDAIVGECQEWIADHYAQPNPVRLMMERSGLAERTFKRRFTAATGMKPVQYVQTLRIEEAKQLLETTGDSVEIISATVGYEDSAFFRRLFKRMAGVSPARYRQKYQAIRNLGAGMGTAR